MQLDAENKKCLYTQMQFEFKKKIESWLFFFFFFPKKAPTNMKSYTWINYHPQLDNSCDDGIVRNDD